MHAQWLRIQRVTLAAVEVIFFLRRSFCHFYRGQFMIVMFCLLRCDSFIAYYSFIFFCVVVSIAFRFQCGSQSIRMWSFAQIYRTVLLRQEAATYQICCCADDVTELCAATAFLFCKFSAVVEMRLTLAHIHTHIRRNQFQPFELYVIQRF